jgi:8-oxo-dGTP pyrophosphatase MutT (NUDIX family)
VTVDDPRRRALAQLLTGHIPIDDREAASRRQVLYWLARLKRPFDRDADAVHVTGSAIVVGERGTVLLEHKRLRRWLQPGGHLESGEDPGAGALREAVEETGLRLRHAGPEPCLVHVDVHPAAAGHLHLDLRYLLVADSDRLAPQPGESQRVAWFSWEEADAIADPSLRGALTAARRLQGWGP